MKKVAVIGSGSWGTALSTLLASTSDEVIIWSREADVAESINKEHVNCRHLSDSELPHNIVSTTSEATLFDASRGCHQERGQRLLQEEPEGKAD